MKEGRRAAKHKLLKCVPQLASAGCGRYGCLPVRMARVAHTGHFADPLGLEADKPPESPLALCGYPVHPGQRRKTSERQAFLHFLIKHRVMTRQEPERLLTALLDTAGARAGYEPVVRQLQSEIRYVRNACIVPKTPSPMRIIRRWLPYGPHRMAKCTQFWGLRGDCSSKRRLKNT